MRVRKKVQLRRAAFRFWLDGHRPTQVVGLGKNIWKCPIANWLKDEGHPEPVVSGSTWRPAQHILIVNDLPEWAQEFLKIVDQSPDLPITADRCREILRGC